MGATGSKDVAVRVGVRVQLLIGALGAQVVENGEVVDEGDFMVSASDLTFFDDWHVTGLRGNRVVHGEARRARDSGAPVSVALGCHHGRVPGRWAARRRLGAAVRG